ncbi:MAG: cytochrome P450 [Segniliparus sp.]|uniref:cytochrome P450 n=1 Tax=Segniliparus sp. TaxID=2804064 RepID=UPI003F341987
MRQSAFLARVLSPAHLMFAGVHPLGYLRWRARGSEPFAVWFPQIGSVLFTGVESGAREVLQAPPGLLESPQPELIAPLIGQGSLLMLSGERHRKERRAVMPALHGSRMRAYEQGVRDAVVAELEGPHGSAATLKANAFSFAVTTRVIEQAVFGGSGGDGLADAMRELLLSYTAPLMLSPALRRGLFPPWRRFLAAKAEFDRLLEERIERRRQAEDGGEGSDILGLLLRATYEDGSPLRHEDLLDELRTMVVAGHETTAAALSWALIELARDERVRTKLSAELSQLGPAAEPDDFARLPYLNAVCQETLRLHPSVPLVLRRLSAPAQFFGQALPEGALIGVALPALHADPASWPQPGRFQPERFIGAHPSHFAFAPFGGGNRRCPGASFASYELLVALGVVLAHVDIGPPRFRGGLWAVTKGIATRPNREARLRVSRRSPAPEPDRFAAVPR